MVWVCLVSFSLFSLLLAMEVVEVGECAELGEEPEEAYTHIVASSASGTHVCMFACVYA